MAEHTKPVAGIDTGKLHLDLALHTQPDVRRVTNDPNGWPELIAHVRAHGVEHVGIEASGGYERGVVAALRAAGLRAAGLRAAGLRVSLHQPKQIKAFAKARLQRAKNDRLDARLIAAFTALITEHQPERSAPDPRLQPLADHLVFIEQAMDDATRARLRLEHQHDPRLRRQLEADLRRTDARVEREFGLLLAKVRAEPDLAERFDLLCSIQGLGEKTAVRRVVLMPELGSLSREQAASLAGLAPYDHDSGQHEGERHIAGGRARVRTALYTAALPASHRWNPTLIALRTRLMDRGKTHKKALIACARKLLTYANAVLARGTPWKPEGTPG